MNEVPSFKIQLIQRKKDSCNNLWKISKYFVIVLLKNLEFSWLESSKKMGSMKINLRFFFWNPLLLLHHISSVLFLGNAKRPKVRLMEQAIKFEIEQNRKIRYINNDHLFLTAQTALIFKIVLTILGLEFFLLITFFSIVTFFIFYCLDQHFVAYRKGTPKSKQEFW